jgi:5-dehydro-2-deoxygluconokinase
LSDFDLITIGRVNLDLYAQQPGVEFTEVDGWNAMVGGSPTNVALAGSRLGLRTAAFTAVGDDLVGDWVIRSLERAGVETQFVSRKPGRHTSLALRAQRPPDHPLAFYRHDPADIYLTAAEAALLPVERTRVLLVSADTLARGSTPEASRSLIAAARDTTRAIYLDLDLREVNWPDLDAYSRTIAEVIDHVDVVLGTEAEFSTLLGLGPKPGRRTVWAVRERFSGRPCQAIVVKQGAHGATLIVEGQTLRVDSFPVTEGSSVGAGDSFAAGLIRAVLSGADWPRACEFASACAAITVSRLGCSSGFPRTEEVDRFVDAHTLVTAK